MTPSPQQIHQFFEVCALFLGSQYYRHSRLKAGSLGLLHGRDFYLAVACIFGAAIGNKAAFWIEFPQLFWSAWIEHRWLLGGQSMVGGLLGGILGIEISKRMQGITYSTGDDFVFPILLGLIIGRIGCFLGGLSDGTFGNPTQLPWGYDFGDGIPRHPTQLYEILFSFALWICLATNQKRISATLGLKFRLFLCSYLAWRLIIDMIKPIPYSYFGIFSGIQIICLVALAYYLPSTFNLYRKRAL